MFFGKLKWDGESFSGKLGKIEVKFKMVDERKGEKYPHAHLLIEGKELVPMWKTKDPRKNSYSGPVGLMRFVAKPARVKGELNILVFDKEETSSFSTPASDPDPVPDFEEPPF